MKRFIQNFFQEAKESIRSKNLSKKSGYLLIVGLLGLLLLLLGNIFSSSETSEDSPMEEEVRITPEESSRSETTTQEDNESTTDVGELETSYEKDLIEMLEKIQGVSDVEVMVNLNSTEVKVYEKNLITSQQTNEEEDTNGGTRTVEDSTQETQVVLVRQGDQEVPLLIQTEKPEVRGVFVVANGVDHATVKQWVVESVSRVLDVSSHRVSVMPKN
ncbi:stage III sporulation protein AG [Oceanobacillus halotolerans]|uniref:stage III sporulation protein AG n=1 Tax=Oceanobacillus halotolerans TaxID=2663380 RepID=UPI001CF7CD72|nr:stage III sporulation protein AG [Oceanobacillus halotolerans]